MRAYFVAATLLATAANANAAENAVTIDYMLPAVSVAAAVQQRITHCPAPAAQQFDKEDGDPALEARFAYTVALTSKTVPRRLVSLNAESGFLVDRETKVHFADDWYLKDFNGKTTGQGGALLVSVIKAGAAVYAMAANPIIGVGALAATGAVKPNDYSKSIVIDLDGIVPEPPKQKYRTQFYMVCQDKVLDALARLESRTKDVADLEAKVISGDASPATQELLATRRKEVSEIQAELTIGAAADKPIQPRLKSAGSFENLETRIPPVDISRWFRISSVRVPVKAGARSGVQPRPTVARLLADRNYPGAHGYQVAVTPDELLARAFGCDPTAGVEAECVKAVNESVALHVRDLVYNRPIPASVKLYPFRRDCAVGAACPQDRDWKEGAAASGAATTKLPQLSRLFTLRTGGSIVGGRTVGAEFGLFGEPTMIQYNIGSAGKDVAGILDASVAAAQSARDAEIAATKRRLDELKSAIDLQDLIDEVYAKPAT